MTNQDERVNVKIVLCPTGEIVASHLTKPLQGKSFTYLIKIIMGHDLVSDLVYLSFEDVQYLTGVW
jgi:hypothetical protein